MKFSYKLLKQLVPQIKNQNELVDKLTMHAFEIDSVKGDTIDIKLPPNRYSDAGSHIGIAREIAAISNYKLKTKNYGQKEKNKKKSYFNVKIQDKNLCPRYTAQYFENIKISASPKWIQDVLKTCGLRPINNVVDIMNYVMLETGQPLHAFDYDKLYAKGGKQPTIIIRKANKGEKIISLDGEKYNLDPDVLVISDEKEVLAIAGIKGGKIAEVDKNTKRIIVESANFDPVNIYKTSKKLLLSTDASLRFSRNLSPELAILGLNRAGQLLIEIAKASSGAVIDVYPKKQSKKIVKFDTERFRKFIGLGLDFKTFKNYFESLGFIVKVPADQLTNSPINQFFVEVSLFRVDIETFEDLAEEIVRLYGYGKLKSVPPYAFLKPSGFEDQIVLKNKIRKILTGIGLSEIYNYSFISDKEGELDFGFAKNKLIELENPISSQFKYLRPNLEIGLVKNISDNSRFFNEVHIFEIGKIFSAGGGPADGGEIGKVFSAKGGSAYGGQASKETLALGMILSDKNQETFFKLKGIISALFKKIGLVNYSFTESEANVLLIKSGNKFLGSIRKKYDSPKKQISSAEINLDELLVLIEGEHEFRPLPKFPSVMRDISIAVLESAKVGNIIEEIQEANMKYIEDVDLIDEYDLTKSNSSA
ncbi:MAG: phenylalanine--tRNA ligase subunit beta, partial [Patescibacteria group bacterium]